MKQIEITDFQRKLPGAVLKMTGTDYANLVASYVARRFAQRSLKVYREIRIGKTIIGKNRCIDIFCVAEDSSKAFAVECKFQDSQGTVDEKIPYALDDLLALPATEVVTVMRKLLEAVSPREAARKVA